jgi:outer membrane beta-barrel protein
MNIGYWPLDHFNTFTSTGAAYAYYFNDYLAWEMVNYQALANTSTGLESYLNKTFAAQPESFDIMRTTTTTNLIYTPFYMKSVFASRSIVWGDLSFVLGGGSSQFERNKNVSTIDFGMIFRFLLGQKFSTKVDLRTYQFASKDIKPNLILSVGVAYSFGGGSSPETAVANSQEDF